MTQIQLFIENEEIELTEQIQFALNKQFEDINNPTKIFNDYSKTIKIPFSINNNRLFGKIFSPDRLIVNGPSDIGMYFDPYRKLDFKLIWNNNILMTGYAKLLNIVKELDHNYYEVSLNGELGKIFQELQKMTFVYNEDTSTYFIDTKEYFEEVIDKDLVYKSWNTAGQQTMNLEKQFMWIWDPSQHKAIKVKNPLYRFTDICGFTPSNCYDADFQYDTVQIHQSTTIRLDDLLETQNFKAITGYDAETVIGDGMMPRGMGEFRSYYQTPFIYFNKLFKIFQEKAQSLTGYTFDLDSVWFNNENPYWRNLAMSLNKINISKNDIDLNANIYHMTANKQHSGSSLNWEWYDFKGNYDTLVTTPVTQDQIISEDASISCSFNVPLPDRYFQMPSNNIQGLLMQGQIEMGLSSPVHQDPRDTNRIKEDNGLFVNVNIIYGDATESSTGITDPEVFTYKYCIIDQARWIQYPDPDIVYLKIQDLSENASPNFNISVPINYMFSKDVQRIKINISFKWEQPGYPLQNTHILLTPRLDIRCQNFTFKQVFQMTRSFSKFSLADLWDNEYGIFDIILRYCKMFRIVIYADYINKKIYFRQQKQYFSNYKIEDWTDKLDMKQPYKLEPVHWDYKYIDFNYEDPENALGKLYKEKYGQNYGEYKLKTAYNFNDETQELFKDCQTSIINTDNILDWNDLFDTTTILYKRSSSEEFLYSKDDDQKYVNSFGQFYFYSGLKYFDSGLRSPYITDDTVFQANNNIFCFIDPGDDRVPDTYYRTTDRYLSLNNFTLYRYRNYLSLFNKPMEGYTKNDHFSSAFSIYDAFWRRYIEERYSIHNKKLTAYFNLTPKDFMNFQFNTFVTIENQLYFVNKIFDYDVTSEHSVKVELLTVQDISNYYQNDF